MFIVALLVKLYVNFHNNRTMWSTNLHVKVCRWEGGKSHKFFLYFIYTKNEKD